MVVPAVILASPELHGAQRLVESPGRLGFVPEGLGLIAQLPIGPPLGRILFVIALSTATTAILGFWSRASRAILTLSAGLLFSLSQRQGAVLHDMHLFWMAALLAASPCGDALSLDARGKPAPPPLSGRAAPDVDRQERAPRLPIFVGAALCLAVAVQGLRARTDAWPFACYPTFGHLQSATIPDIVVELAVDDGTTRRVTGREERTRSQEDWGRAFRLSGAYGDRPPELALRVYAREVVLGAHVNPDNIERTRILRVAIATESWQEAPRGGVLVSEVTDPP